MKDIRVYKMGHLQLTYPHHYQVDYSIPQQETPFAIEGSVVIRDYGKQKQEKACTAKVKGMTFRPPRLARWTKSKKGRENKSQNQPTNTRSQDSRMLTYINNYRLLYSCEFPKAPVRDWDSLLMMLAACNDVRIMIRGQLVASKQNRHWRERLAL